MSSTFDVELRSHGWQLPFKAKKFRQKILFKEFLEKSISKNTFHAVVFYVAYTNITNIYGVEKWEFAK